MIYLIDNLAYSTVDAALLRDYFAYFLARYPDEHVRLNSRWNVPEIIFPNYQYSVLLSSFEKWRSHFQESMEMNKSVLLDDSIPIMSFNDWFDDCTHTPGYSPYHLRPEDLQADVSYYFHSLGNGSGTGRLHLLHLCKYIDATKLTDVLEQILYMPNNQIPNSYEYYSHEHCIDAALEVLGRTRNPQADKILADYLAKSNSTKYICKALIALYGHHSQQILEYLYQTLCKHESDMPSKDSLQDSIWGALQLKIDCSLQVLEENLPVTALCFKRISEQRSVQALWYLEEFLRSPYFEIERWALEGIRMWLRNMAYVLFSENHRAKAQRKIVIAAMKKYGEASFDSFLYTKLAQKPNVYQRRKKLQ